MIISGEARIAGVMGWPVGHSKSPRLHNFWLEQYGIDGAYVPLAVRPGDIAAALRALAALGFAAVNLTVPHKQAVIPFLDEVDEWATAAGAVNTIVNRDGRLTGHNTDGPGFLQALLVETGYSPDGTRALILGAGGAARAISVELGLAGAAEMTIVNRSLDRGQALVDLLNDDVKVPAKLVVWEDDYSVPEGADVVINATSIGLGDAEARVPLDVDTLTSEMVVADVIFTPPLTRLMRDAAERGCTTLDGLGMLVNQAVIGFKIWTDVDADPAVMR